MRCVLVLMLLGGLLSGPLAVEEPEQWTALALSADGQELLSVGSLTIDDADARLIGAGAADWTYAPALLSRWRLHDAAPGEEALEALEHIAFAQGAWRPTALAVHAERVWVAGWASPAFIESLSDLPGLRLHDPAFPQRGHRVYIPPEHHDEPRVRARQDQRGAAVVLAFSADLSQVLAMATLEGWESSWFVPAQLREVWRQRMLLQVLDDGDLVVVHDGGMNRLPTANPQADFADYSLAVDYVSRLSPELDARRWRSELTGPAIDAAAISKTITRGVHFRGTRAEGWEHPVLGNPRSFDLILDAAGTGVWVAGLSSSRTNEEPWWTPFIRHIDAQGRVTDGPFSPSPTDGGGRLQGQVADSGVFGIALAADQGLYAAVISDGGNTVTRRHPLRPLEGVSGWQGQVEPFRGRTLLWGGLVRMDAGHELLWGRHLGGAGRNRRDQRTQLPCWGERVLVLDAERVLVGGRIAPGAQILDQRSEDWSSFLMTLDGAGNPMRVSLFPQTRIKDLIHDPQGNRLWWAGWNQAGPLLHSKHLTSD